MIALDIGQLAPSRKTPKKGIELNVMVLGKTGLGKACVVNTLLNSRVLEPTASDMRTASDSPHDVQPPHTAAENTASPQVVAQIPPLPQPHSPLSPPIKISTVDLDDKSSKIRLSLIQVAGFGDNLDNSGGVKPVVDYIDTQLAMYLEGESGLNRRAIIDTRVHICLYFIAPDHRGLKTLDIDLMKAIHNKVNLFPLLSKADSYTNQELMEMKQKVIKDLNSNEIKIYEFPECDNEDDPEFISINNEMKKLVPFAVIGGAESVSIGGKTFKGRQYPWGFVNVDDPMNSDLIYLRKMLFRSHTHDLRDITNEIHYENYRAQVLMNSGKFSNVLDNLQPVENSSLYHSVDGTSREKL